MDGWKTDIRAAARRHLESGCTSLLKNAVFLFERLTEGVEGIQAQDILLHATCLEKLGEFRSALSLLEKFSSELGDNEDARFIKAFCLYELRQFVDAKSCLLYDPRSDQVRSYQDVQVELQQSGNRTRVPREACGLHLLGKIAAKQSGLEDEAQAFFEMAVQLDPFLFDAREYLATMRGRKRQVAEDISVPTQVWSTLQDSVMMLRTLEDACFLLASYQCDQVLECVAKLPIETQHSAYVLNLVGRAYFEMADYVAACSAFERMRLVDPNRTQGLEIYSTALWHLKKEVELAYLARDISERSPKRPETWCVVGNCFSLEKEHDLAIRFFKRSLQLDENFTYAYTLTGHEYIAKEDFDEATACYRHAIRTDKSHYNAWWGLGTIYSRQEKYRLAELHFRRAIAIHPGNSVLCCFLGTVLAKDDRYDEALEALDAAKVLQPNNPQARFQRAKVLWHSDRWEEALEELEFVRDVVPKEPSVHMFMGKVCNKLKQRDQAMVHFLAALDLDPKGGTDVREAMNQLDGVEEPVGAHAEVFDVE